MPGDSAQPDRSSRTQLLASVIDQLACPACYAALLLDATALQCTGCGRRFPISQGIPVLIPDRADRE
jgi:uncharacterized protein YbaR (Trm112 family)